MFSLAESGVNADTYVDNSDDATLGSADSFNVPKISVDDYVRIISASDV